MEAHECAVVHICQHVCDVYIHLHTKYYMQHEETAVRSNASAKPWHMHTLQQIYVYCGQGPHKSLKLNTTSLQRSEKLLLIKTVPWTL